MEKKLKIFETFAGYGGWSFSLRELNIPHETVGYSEVDKYAIQCYEQNHNGKNYGDITKINPHELPDFDLFVSSPPCQAFSVAGKGQGQDDEKGRGRLFEDAINIMRVKQPKYAVYENVKGLTNKKHTDYFDYIVRLMKEAGYNVFYKVLNTKEHGIPQNRERIFFVCIREDIDSAYFQFPQKQELNILLKDILEDEVDEKYYLKPERVEKLLANVKEKGVWNTNPSGKGMNGKVDDSPISRCLSTNKGEGHKVAVPVLTPDRMNKQQNGRRFKEDGDPMFTLNTQDRHGILEIGTWRTHKDGNGFRKMKSNVCPTIPARARNDGSGMPCIRIKNATAKGYLEATVGDGVNLEQPNSKTRRARVQPQSCATLQCNDARGVVVNNLQIRKLTPKECFRLQGFLNDEINLEGLSNSQQYKLAGNGVSINVCAKLLRNLLK